MLLGFLTMILVLAMGFIRQNLLDWGWMKEQSVVEKTEHIRDVRLEQPFTIKLMDTI